MGGVALNRLKFLISTVHDWSKKTKITTGRIFLRLRYLALEFFIELLASSYEKREKVEVIHVHVKQLMYM